ncbi:glycoside hydrolase family 28 protein [bacterium]|nr:MAG: glycoside hydrolase family 28 protein [bacterium]
MKRFSSLPFIVGCGLIQSHSAFAQVNNPTIAILPPAPTVSAVPAPVFSGEFNVRAFGAIGDGKTLDSPAINRAIEAAAAAGGGTVRLPTGTYLSLSLRLKSNIRLHLDQGAVLLAARRTEEWRYDAAEESPSTKFQDFGHSHWQNSLIWGDGLQNVTIDGAGEIYGQGLERHDKPRVEGEGNKAISLKFCRNVNISDITIRHGGWFGILATGVDNLTIDNLKIDTDRDGMDIDCCRNVRISNCSVNSPGDDGICLKSSYGLNEARATENVTISNCFVSGYNEGTMLDGTYKWNGRSSPTGRIKFGTESNGGFKNITVSNCVFDKCRGLALETVDGGLLEDVSINNITMRDITNAPIFLRLGRRMRGPEGTSVGELRRINISNVVIYNADSASSVLIMGVPGHAIEDVALSNIQIWFKGGGTKEQAAIVPPERENDYPEPDRFGRMPSYGFFMRHVKGITLENIRLHTLKNDERPPFVLDDVDGAEFYRVKAEHKEGRPLFAIKNSSNLTMRMVDGVEDKQQKALFQGNF